MANDTPYKTTISFVHIVSFVYVRQPRGCTYTKRRKNKMNRKNKAGCPENEKWQKFKKEFWEEKLLATTERGLIDFDPQGKDDMVGGDTLSYDEYLDLQMQSGKK